MKSPTSLVWLQKGNANMRSFGLTSCKVRRGVGRTYQAMVSRVVSTEDGRDSRGHGQGRGCRARRALSPPDTLQPSLHPPFTAWRAGRRVQCTGPQEVVPECSHRHVGDKRIRLVQPSHQVGLGEALDMRISCLPLCTHVQGPAGFSQGGY